MPKPPFIPHNVARIQPDNAYKEVSVRSGTRHPGHVIDFIISAGKSTYKKTEMEIWI